MNKSIRKRSAIALLTLVLSALAGCSTVEPWQKGNLADYTMRDDRDTLSKTMTAHVQFSREASAGGDGVGGGGCGCN